MNNAKLVTKRSSNGKHDIETAVISRYAQGAATVEKALCCPSDAYDPQYLGVIPQEIIEKDYGCGDPSRYVNSGETVLDLGSGAGKICYILAQKTGPNGRVIGLDFNDAMLELARRYEDEIAAKIGYQNVAFRKARIQDMALDLDEAQRWLDANPVTTIEELGRFQAHCNWLRHQQPLVPSASIDVVVSNCVLNLVKAEEKEALFREIFRVLKKGGRAVISDIVCDEVPTEATRNDADLWSGCIAGAFQELAFLEMFEAAGFHGIEILSRSDAPWQTIEGIEFRSMTVRAFKGKQGPCLERNQAVVYRGPWKQVQDDDGHVYRRGQRSAVCDKTFNLLTNPAGPYAGNFMGIEPLYTVPIEAAHPFDCSGGTVRHPRQTKGSNYSITDLSNAGSCTDGGCC